MALIAHLCNGAWPNFTPGACVEQFFIEDQKKYLTSHTTLNVCALCMLSCYATIYMYTMKYFSVNNYRHLFRNAKFAEILLISDRILTHTQEVRHRLTVWLICALLQGPKHVQELFITSVFALFCNSNNQKRN